MSCPFCHSIAIKRQYPISDIFGVVRKMQECADCGVVYLSPPPTPNQVEQAYDDSYYGLRQTKFSWPVEPVIEWFRMGRARRIHRKLGGKGSVLDIGCGNGQFLGHLSALGEYHITGNENGSKALERAASIPGIRLIEGDLLKLPELPGIFDAVTLYHVFEHLPDPRGMLDALAGMSKKGTLVEISIPNIESFQARIFKGKWLHQDPPRHLFHMPPEKLIREMSTRGFRLTSKSGLSAEQNPFGWVQSLLNVLLMDRDVLLERLKGNHAYAPRYRRFSILAMKGFMLFGMPVFILSDFLEHAFGRSATLRLTFRKN